MNTRIYVLNAYKSAADLFHLISKDIERIVDIDLTAIILCNQLKSLSVDMIRGQLEHIAPGVQFEEALVGTAAGGGEAKGAVVSFDGVMMAILEVAAALPLESLIYGPSPMLFWPTAAQELANHSAHIRVMIIEPGKLGKPIIELVQALTQLAASVCMTTEAIGVLWCASDHLMSASRFVQIVMTPKDKGQMLCTIWVRLFVAQAEAGLIVATHGLAALTERAELEFAPTKSLDLATLARRAMQFSHFIINGLMTLQPGKVAPDNFRVSEGRSSFEDRPALRLAVPAQS